MKRLVVLVAVATSVLLAGCAGAGSGAPSGSGGPAGTGQPSAAPNASDSGAGASGDTSAQFGGDICSALTKADIEAATYPQGPATFSSTDTQKSADTGKPVVCQYLVTFDGKPSIVGAYIALLDDSEIQYRRQVALFSPLSEAVSGIGTEASVVQAAPGLYEVWVTGTHGKFTVGAQAKATAIALATMAAGRN